MFNKILIATRGEIACRIIRTAHCMGIQCVAVYSEADTNALHVRMADEAYYIGLAPPQESYLRGDVILKIAKECGAQAIHPGYGFLAENAEFAEACAKAKICFIGPSVKAIRAMGSKSEAKKVMAKADVPLIPGYHEDNQDPNVLHKAADKIGYPVLLKPSAGGGGKGMRIVDNSEEFITALAATKREAKASFGDDHVLIEKYVTKPRHVEFQIFADQKGNTVYLFERDCSIQRRHQKIIEEAPAPGMTDQLRKQMGETAIEAAKAIDYIGAGTIEFLLDDNNKFYFMEMNTRLQVEHPVTEMITGLDLVEWQLKVAGGETLPLKQKDLKIKGHAFEARIYAEDPQNNFLPSTGFIRYLKTPSANSHTRIDSGIEQGDQVSQYYDPMIAKLITWGEDRETALHRLSQALNEYQIIGVTSNLDLLSKISREKHFIAGKFDTSFIAKYEKELLQQPLPDSKTWILASLYILLQQQIKAKHVSKQNTDLNSPWNTADNWRSNLPRQQKLTFNFDHKEKSILIQYQTEQYQIIVDNKKFTTTAHLETNYELSATINGEHIKANVFYEKNQLYILMEGQRFHLTYFDMDHLSHDREAEKKAQLVAPMPGKVVALLVKAGQEVEAGTGIAIIEAMKMEHTIHAPSKGIIKEWYFKVGDQVNEGTELLAFKEI